MWSHRSYRQTDTHSAGTCARLGPGAAVRRRLVGEAKLHATQGDDFLCGNRIGRHPGPEPRGSGDAAADRGLRGRCRQGGCGNRAHPCARSADHAAQHGPCALPRGGGPHPVERDRRRHQSHHRAGRAVRAGHRRSAQGRPGNEPEDAAGAGAPRGRDQAGHLQPRHGQHEHGRLCVHQHAGHARSHGGRDPRRRASCPNWKCSRPATSCSPSA